MSEASEDKGALAVGFGAVIVVDDFHARLLDERTEKRQRIAYTVERPFPFPSVSGRVLFLVLHSFLGECRQKNTLARLEDASEFPQVCAHILRTHMRENGVERDHIDRTVLQR